MRELRVGRPLLIDVGAGVGEDAVVELRVVPGHDERAGAAGASTHGGAGLGVVGELNVNVRLNRWEHLLFHKLRVTARHGVVFQATFAALRIASTIGNGDRDHGRYAMLGDEVVESIEH